MTHRSHIYFDDPALTRLMGMVTALAGEVFVLKAQHRRLAAALEKSGGVTEEQLAAVGSGTDMADWMAAERDAFAAAIMAPLIEPDVAQVEHDEIFGTGKIARKIAKATAREPGK